MLDYKLENEQASHLKVQICENFGVHQMAHYLRLLKPEYNWLDAHTLPNYNIANTFKGSIGNANHMSVPSDQLRTLGYRYWSWIGSCQNGRFW